MSQPIERVVEEAIAGAGGRRPIDLDAPWREVGIDSLDLLDVVLRAERALDCSIPDEAAVRLFTPRDLILALAAAQGPGSRRVAVPVVGEPVAVEVATDPVGGVESAVPAEASVGRGRR
ncbi:MAG TPA: phosphopantetheine-binding protein [Candidatus Limnocylindrales bacterium]|nr:phosphopantetheine-binding protein [Candidatus Limnocylindrales bacterium]